MERGQHVSKGETIAKLDGTVVNANLKIVKDKINAVKNKILRLEIQKQSILNETLKDDSYVQLDKINADILNKHFDEYMIKLKTFSSDLLRIDKEIASMSKDQKLMSDQLQIKIKIEEGKKNLFKKNVGSLIHTLN